MKDIGNKFKEARESIGVSLEEAAEDLQITVPQLENLEDGNANAFKDIFFLKDLIKKYAKYLNIKEDDVIDEFNDFIFNFTSRIPVIEIEEKVKELHKEERTISSKKIVSPYTYKTGKKNNVLLTLLYIILPIIIFVIVILVLILFSMNK